MQKVYKLFSSATATTNAAATLTFQRRGIITGVLFAAVATLASGGAMQNELSFASTGQLSTSDTVGPIAQFNYGQTTVTSGTYPMGYGQHVPMNVAINSGDRIYVNQVATGTVTASLFNVYIFVNE